MQSLEKQYRALANRRRLAILKYLLKVKTASVTNVAENLKLSIKATSKHLSMLASVGAVDSEQKGFYKIYEIATAPPTTVKQALKMI